MIKKPCNVFILNNDEELEFCEEGPLNHNSPHYGVKTVQVYLKELDLYNKWTFDFKFSNDNGENRSQ